MKNMDPKLMAGVMIAIIVLCGIVVVRALGFGGKPTPPPIMSGGPGSASLTLPAAPATGASGGAPAPTMSPGGSMTLPTPPTTR